MAGGVGAATLSPWSLHCSAAADGKARRLSTRTLVTTRPVSQICDTFSQGNFGASVCQDGVNLACAQARQQSRAHLMILPFSQKKSLSTWSGSGGFYQTISSHAPAWPTAKSMMDERSSISTECSWNIPRNSRWTKLEKASTPPLMSWQLNQLQVHPQQQRRKPSKATKTWSPR